jgi:hypothetical protein
MTEPDPPSILDRPGSSGLGRLLEAARRDPGLDPSAVERVARRAEVPAAPSVPVLRLALTVLGVLALAGALGWRAWAPSSARPEPPPPPAPAPPSLVEVPAEVASPAEEVLVPPPPSPPARRPIARSAPPPGPAAPPAVPEAAPPEVDRPSEGALLLRARIALRAHPEDTLALAEEHRATFPDGEMVAEREVLAIEALAAMERFEAARSRAARFAASHPGSPYRARVEAALAREPMAAP